MMEMKCRVCGKTIVSDISLRTFRYCSPVKNCKNCGAEYADPRCREIAVEGIPADTFSVKSYAVMMIFGGFMLYRGIHIASGKMLGLPDEAQWIMPVFLVIAGAGCIIGGLYEIITIKTGSKERKFKKLKEESEQRLNNRTYAHTLKNLGYDVPEKYL